MKATANFHLRISKAFDEAGKKEDARSAIKAYGILIDRLRLASDEKEK